MSVKTHTALDSEFSTNLADNSTKDISAQDVRDAITNLMDSVWGVSYVVSIDDGDSPYTADLDAINTIIADDSSGAITINLPAVASSTHRTLYVKKTSASNTTTLDGNGSEEIESSTTYVMSTQYDYVKIVCDGVGWHVISAT